MDIYNNNLPWSKKVENFCRKVFLISSSAFAIIMGLTFTLFIKNVEIINKIVGIIAIPIVVIWFASFIFWIVFLIYNIKIGGFFKSQTSSTKSMRKKIGWIVFFVWLVLLITFISFMISAPKSGTVINVVGPIVILGTFILLPVWGFLLGNRLIKIITIIPVIFVALFLLVYAFVLQPRKVSGLSMYPNFTDGEYIFSEKVTYRFDSPKRGDVIIFTTPIESRDDLIARIVGLPGEYISIKKNHVYINNKILDEPYIGKDIPTRTGIFLNETNVLIPENSYAVLGDNREHSSDSRFYGFVKRNSIKGRFWFTYWSLSKKG
jgi:signal peptidase I